MTTQHDKAKRRQFGIRHLLATIGVVGILFAMQPHHAGLGILWLTTIGSACAIRFAWQRSRYGAWESIAGGSAGGAIALLVTLIVVYTSDEPFEDEELGFWGCLVFFSLYAAIFGAIFGAFVWLVAIGGRAVYNAQWITRICTNRQHSAQFPGTEGVSGQNDRPNSK